MSNKLKFAFYWSASCGGCEVAVLDVNEKILDVAKIADIVFWPVAIDVKYKDVEAMPDKSIDVCFFNGAVRTSEQEEIAKLLRTKSKIMVSFGSCACLGGIPGLANQYSSEEIMYEAYIKALSVTNEEKVMPKILTKVSEGELELPRFYEKVYTLDEVVEVDYYLPGCPPTAEWIAKAVEAIAKGQLPPKGSVIGIDKTVCEECQKERTSEKKIKKIYRPYEIIPDPKKCLLDQGIICMGPATRGGCKAACPNVNMPCRGCYGPAPNVYDQGAKMMSAVASIIDSTNEEEIEKILSDVKDVIGTFYQFSLEKSFLKGNIKPQIETETYVGEERREYPRVMADYLVVYRVLTEEEKKDITVTKNLSLGGMCLTTNRSFNKGERIILEMKMPFLLQPVILLGEVVDSREIVKDLLYDTHLQFLSTDDKTKELLIKMINV